MTLSYSYVDYCFFFVFFITVSTIKQTRYIAKSYISGQIVIPW